MSLLLRHIGNVDSLRLIASCVMATLRRPEYIARTFREKEARRYIFLAETAVPILKKLCEGWRQDAARRISSLVEATTRRRNERVLVLAAQAARGYTSNKREPRTPINQTQAESREPSLAEKRRTWVLERASRPPGTVVCNQTQPLQPDAAQNKIKCACLVIYFNGEMRYADPRHGLTRRMPERLTVEMAESLQFSMDELYDGVLDWENCEEPDDSDGQVIQEDKSKPIHEKGVFAGLRICVAPYGDYADEAAKCMAEYWISLHGGAITGVRTATHVILNERYDACLLYTSPSPRD